MCESRGVVYWRLGQRWQWMMCLDSGLRDQQAAMDVANLLVRDGV